LFGIHFGDGFGARGAGGEGYETETAGAFGLVIDWEEDVGYCSELAEFFFETLTIRCII